MNETAMHPPTDRHRIIESPAYNKYHIIAFNVVEVEEIALSHPARHDKTSRRGRRSPVAAWKPSRRLQSNDCAYRAA